MIEKYYEETFLNAIIFSSDPKKYYSEKLRTPEFVAKLKEKVFDIGKNATFSDSIKNNLYDLLWYLRESKELVEPVNEIIGFLNTTDFDYHRHINYMVYELGLRSEKFKGINYAFQNLYDTLEYDYIALSSLLCSDEEFEELMKPNRPGQLCLNEFYFLSINKFIDDIPELFNDENVIERISVVLIVNRLFRRNKKAIREFDSKRFRSFQHNNKIMLKKMFK